MSEQKEEVNHPSRYNAGAVECIDAIESALTPEEYRGFIKGTVLRYVWREKHKGGDQDLQKAEWYTRRLLDYEQKRRLQDHDKARESFDQSTPAAQPDPRFIKWDYIVEGCGVISGDEATLAKIRARLAMSADRERALMEAMRDSCIKATEPFGRDVSMIANMAAIDPDDIAASLDQ